MMEPLIEKNKSGSSEGIKRSTFENDLNETISSTGSRNRNKFYHSIEDDSILNSDEFYAVNTTQNEYSVNVNVNESDKIFIDSNDSTQNHINQEKILDLKKNLSSKFIAILREENFEYGIKSQSEELVKEQMKQNALATKSWLNELFITSYGESDILLGILRVISRINEEEINPQGQTMALACMTHNSVEIREVAIRVFENWGSANSLNILKNISISPAWLKEYLDHVVQDLKEELCQY